MSRACYQYADASGNIFRIEPGTLEYIPVTARRSSSGLYSGGDPEKTEITVHQYNALKSHFDDAISDVSCHKRNREMMTGLIIRDVDEKRIRIVLKKASPRRQKIESLLKGTLTKQPREL